MSASTEQVRIEEEFPHPEIRDDGLSVIRMLKAIKIPAKCATHRYVKNSKWVDVVDMFDGESPDDYPEGIVCEELGFIIAMSSWYYEGRDLRGPYKQLQRGYSLWIVDEEGDPYPHWGDDHYTNLSDALFVIDCHYHKQDYNYSLQAEYTIEATREASHG